MGRDIPETIIIELNGCCGCGKSTLAAVLGNLLKEHRIRYVTLSELLNRNPVKWYQNLWSTNRNIGYRLFRYSCSIFPRRFERIQYVKHILNLYNGINEILREGKYQVILLDEGILQGLSSIAYMDCIRRKKTAEQVVNTLLADKKFYIVNCNLNYEALLFRIEKRNRNAGRMDRHREKGEMKPVLKSQYRNLQRLRSLLPQSVQRFDLDMKQESLKNAGLILEQL